MVFKLSKKNKINYGILRYFNVAGASPSGKIISGMVAGDSTNLNLEPYSSLRFS